MTRPWLRTSLLTLVAFGLLAGLMIAKHHLLLSSWAFDEAYLVQQLHNSATDAPVTIRPSGHASGPAGALPFQEQHRKWLFRLAAPLYHALPHAETVIVLYALFAALSLMSLHALAAGLKLDDRLVPWLQAAWALSPWTLQVVTYGFHDALAATGTVYFAWLALLVRAPRWSWLGVPLLLLPREEPALLVLPTLALVPERWRAILAGTAVGAALLAVTGLPAGYALDVATGLQVGFSPASYASFLVTWPAPWLAGRLAPWSVAAAVGFVALVNVLRAPVVYAWPFGFHAVDPVTREAIAIGSYHYYGLVLAFGMGALVLGLARRPDPARRLRVARWAAVLMAGPSLLFVPAQALDAWQRLDGDDVRLLHEARERSAPPQARVAADYDSIALFANRDEAFCYQQPPPGMTDLDVVRRSDVFVVNRRHATPALYRVLADRHLVEVGASPRHQVFARPPDNPLLGLPRGP